MKSILMSIQPKWVKKIISGELTNLVRKFVPKCGVPFKVLMYETLGKTIKTKYKDLTSFDDDYRVITEREGRGQVVGEIIIDEVKKDGEHWQLYKDTVKSKRDIYAWHISDLKVYDKPKEIGEFYRCSDGKCQSYNCKSKYCGIVIECGNLEQLTRPPQSWQYVQE
jgi:predicted transcriptional regulator